MSGARPRRWRWGEPVTGLRELIARGGLLAIPTESSYGLAADPQNPEAVARVFAVKGRPAGRPLPVVVADVQQIESLGGDLAVAAPSGLVRAWPAALTLLLPIARPVPAAAGSTRLGFRIPAHPRLRRLLSDLGTGLTATSANRSGEPPILRPADLEPLLAGRDAAIVDDGELPGGPPSTIVGFADGRPEVVRRGRFDVEQRISFSASSVEISVDDPR